MFNIDDVLRGYSAEQYSAAIVETLIQFLIGKGLISNDEVRKYFESNFNQIFQQIIKRDREESKKAYEKYEANIKESK